MSKNQHYPKWVLASDEKPPELYTVFCKSKYRKKMHHFTGALNPRIRKIMGNGGTYPLNKVKWLKEGPNHEDHWFDW